MFVLINTDQYLKSNLIEVPFENIRYFDLKYAHSKHGWTIPVYIAVVATNGFWSVFTLAPTLIISINATKAGKYRFKSKKNEIVLQELSMYARFPQGIPPGLDKSKIKVNDEYPLKRKKRNYF